MWRFPFTHAHTHTLIKLTQVRFNPAMAASEPNSFSFCASPHSKPSTLYEKYPKGPNISYITYTIWGTRIYFRRMNPKGPSNYPLIIYLPKTCTILAIPQNPNALLLGTWTLRGTGIPNLIFLSKAHKTTRTLLVPLIWGIWSPIVGI